MKLEDSIQQGQDWFLKRQGWELPGRKVIGETGYYFKIRDASQLLCLPP